MSAAGTAHLTLSAGMATLTPSPVAENTFLRKKTVDGAEKNEAHVMPEEGGCAVRGAPGSWRPLHRVRRWHASVKTRHPTRHGPCLRRPQARGKGEQAL